MSNAVADEPVKKNEPVGSPDSKVFKDFPDTVVIRVWAAREKLFINPIQTRARYKDVKGVHHFKVWEGFGPVTVGSEIKYGDILYIVKTAMKGGFCTAEKKVTTTTEKKKP